MSNPFKPSYHEPFDSILGDQFNFKRRLHRTFGELFSDCRSIDIIFNRNEHRLELVYSHGRKREIGEIVKVQDCDYEVAPIDWAFVRATVWPTRVDRKRRSTDELFAGIRDIILQHGFSENVSLTATHFVFATWFNEILPIAPCLLITGPPPEANCLLDILACVVRRPLQFGTLDRSVLASLPYAFRPTLLLTVESLSEKARELLSITSRPGRQLARGTTVLDASFAKAVYCRTSSTTDGFGDSMIPVNLAPIRGRLPILSADTRLQIADEFQPRLLRYRASNHVAVRQAHFDLPECCPQIRMLGRVLGSPIVAAPEIQSGLKNLLTGFEVEARAERACDVKSIVVEVLLSFSHSCPNEKLYVGEVTAAAEEIQNSRGETGALEARKIGDILRSIGLRPTRDNKGFSIILTENLRNEIHKLARDSHVTAFERSPPCEICKELLTVSSTAQIDEEGLEGQNAQ